MKAFEYLETCNEQEKEELANYLKKFYNEMLILERNAFNEYRENKRSTKKKREYFDCVTRLGAFNDLLDLLHIDIGQNEL